MRSVLQPAVLAVACLGLGFALTAGTGGSARERRTRRPRLIDLALGAAVAAIVATTLTPRNGPSHVQVVPLGDIVDAFRPTVDEGFLLVAAANIVLFVPLGAALALRRVPLGRSVVLGLALSAAVEIAQLLVVSGRTTSVDDVLLNTLGAVAGYLALVRLRPPGPARGESLAERA